SFFTGKKTPYHKIMAVIYFFLCSEKHISIIEKTKLSPNTVGSIIDDIYILMEGDLKTGDMQVG
ncbi:hypothetical protein BDC45DRAFT_419485, partial [Circinella umbellata]